MRVFVFMFNDKIYVHPDISLFISIIKYDLENDDPKIHITNGVV